MRNAYTYINFGDFVDGSTNTTADPYVRMLSTTNDSAAVHAAFVSVRGDSPWTPSGATLAEKLRARRTLIIAVAAGAGALLLLVIAGCCWSSARKRRAARTGRAAFFGPPRQPYQQLHEPAPEAYDMHAVQGQHGRQPSSYANPWDARY